MDEMKRGEWFSDAGFGMFTHWTTHSLPMSGEMNSYQQAVDDFRIDEYVDAVAASGAKFLFFTITHAMMYMPFPLPEMDAIVTGHTCRRDLMGELYEKLAGRGIKLMFYFNGDGSVDPAWQEAAKFHTDPLYHAEKVYEVVAAISKKYGRKLCGWWIDCCYDKDWHGETGTRYDYKRYAEAVRAGNPDSIVAFNYRGTSEWLSETGRGIADYQAGEENDIERRPESKFSGEGGARWFGLCWMDQFWLHDKPEQPVPRYSDAQVIEYIDAVTKAGGVFAYNTAPYREGLISEPAKAQLRHIGDWLRAKNN